MVTGTDAYVVSICIDAPPKSKFSREVKNAFVIDNTYLEQAYFWTKEWQEGEKEAEEDIKHGRMRNPGSAKDTIQHLHSKRNKRK
jgi:epoxyqueuosine reductase QueG